MKLLQNVMLNEYKYYPPLTDYLYETSLPSCTNCDMNKYPHIKLYRENDVQHVSVKLYTVSVAIIYLHWT